MFAAKNCIIIDLSNVYAVQSHYLNQMWLIVSWDILESTSVKYESNTNILIHS